MKGKLITHASGAEAPAKEGPERHSLGDRGDNRRQEMPECCGVPTRPGPSSGDRTGPCNDAAPDQVAHRQQCNVASQQWSAEGDPQTISSSLIALSEWMKRKRLSQIHEMLASLPNPPSSSPKTGDGSRANPARSNRCIVLRLLQGLQSRMTFWLFLRRLRRGEHSMWRNGRGGQP